MKTATISEAKNGLSAFLKLVQKGETVLILDRDTPVAQLVPLEPFAEARDEALLKELERKGVLRRPRRSGASKLLLTPPPDVGGDVLAALLTEREDGR